MTAHLLLITLGPVQEFIAQARRSRDLWFGSHLLSELSRAVAKVLAEEGAALIFPALHPRDGELLPSEHLLRPGTGQPPLNVANKILAEIPAGLDPEALARKARNQGAYQRWQAMAASCKNREAELLATGAPEFDAIWQEQIDSFVEFLAAWTPLAEGGEAYRAARHTLESAIAGRKGVREFAPFVHQRGGVPKSSLDGARETVLADPRELDDTHRSLFEKRKNQRRIAEGEHLDAVGLIKRTGGQPEQFVPLANIALAAWIEHADKHAGTAMTALQEACDQARQDNRFTVENVHRPDIPWTTTFPWDAQLFFKDRWHPLLKEAGLADGRERMDWAKHHVQPILNLKGMKEPNPYVACLVADGDHMGKAMERLMDAKAHRHFAQELSRFAGDARRIVEQEHRGLLIYSGGDDVLAFVCLPDALACADALRESFNLCLTQAMAHAPLAGKAPPPSLSVGIGVGHTLADMRELLALGRKAEKMAKQHRNTLAVLVDKRSGGASAWQGCWDDEPVTRLQSDIQLLGTRLPMGKVYEVQQDLARFPGPDGLTNPAQWATMLRLDVARTLARSETGQEGVTLRPEDVGLPLDPELDYAALRHRIHHWIERMVVARAFAQAQPGQEIQP